MNYTVVWMPGAELRLVDLWLEGPDQLAIRATADAIDKALHENPLDLGESREGSLRVLIQPPLAVLYDVSESYRLVRVHSAWRWGNRP